MAVKPKLAMIPSGYKGGASSGDLYSVLPSDGVGDFDFSRSGSATRINKDGLIETVTSNVPRLNYPLIDGVVSGCPSLLLEPASTNLVTYSEDFSNSYWVKTGLLAPTSGFISPDGTANARKLVENTSSGNHSITRGVVASLGSAANYALSFYIKKGERSKIIASIANSAFYFVNFDLEDVTAKITGKDVQKATIKEVSNDWFYCTILSEIQIGITPSARIYLADDSFSNSYQGDGTSGLYVWGFQLEQSSFSTSYIPNYGTVLGVTRSAEICNNAGDVNTFNDSEGVLFGEISALNNTVDGYKTINIGSNNVDNRLGFGFDNQSRIYGFKRTNTSWNIPIEANINEFNKVAISYDTNNNHFWLNGFKVGSNTTIGDITQPIELDFRASYGGEQFNGSTKQLQYFDTALTDTDLEELTSWTSFNEMATGQLYTII